VGAEVENVRGGRVFWHLSGIGGLGRCLGVRVMYGSFGGATVHGDAAYSTQMCSLNIILRKFCIHLNKETHLYI